MNGGRILSWLLAQPVTEDAVRALDDADLCAVTGHLCQNYDENGVTGTVLGICMVHGALRWVEEQQRRSQAAATNREGFL